MICHVLLEPLFYLTYLFFLQQVVTSLWIVVTGHNPMTMISTGYDTIITPNLWTSTAQVVRLRGYNYYEIEWKLHEKLLHICTRNMYWHILTLVYNFILSQNKLLTKQHMKMFVATPVII